MLPSPSASRWKIIQVILARSLIEPFITFVSSMYGVEAHRNPAPHRDEIARFVLRERLYVIREFSDSRSDAVEVFSSDKDGVQEMERLWYQILQQPMEDSSESIDGSE